MPRLDRLLQKKQLRLLQADGDGLLTSSGKTVISFWATLMDFENPSD